jgi:Iap family predicted aminopeptidase
LLQVIRHGAAAILAEVSERQGMITTGECANRLAISAAPQPETVVL